MKTKIFEGGLGFFLLVWFSTPLHAQMELYASTPPFVSGSVPPNIMLIVDNSGSMYRFAYFDGWETPSPADDNWGTSAANPCVDFDPSFSYYGYFNSAYWYGYGSSRFYPAALKASRGKNSTEWDGNFLNWLSMRRIDVLRKALTGGRLAASGGENRLIGEAPDSCNDRGAYKQIGSALLYSPYSGSVTFEVCKTGSTAQIKKGGDRYNINVSQGGVTPTGVLQRVGQKARWGLSFYHPNTSGLTHATDQGGFVQAAIQTRDNASLESAIVNEINNTQPDSNTPLAEVLWTVTGYYAQQSSLLGGPGPMYKTGDYQVNLNVDPYNHGTGGSPVWAWCAKSFVILITDGEPCADGRLPGSLADYANGRSDYNCSERSGDLDAPCYLPECSAGGYVPGVEDVALYAHTTDLRDDLGGIQNFDLYTIFAFGAGSRILKYAAINGGFIDQNANNVPDLEEEWDENGDGVPDTYFEAPSGQELEEKLEAAITDILQRVASGTAISVLATSAEGEGSLFQAFFRPSLVEDTREVTWLGYLQGLWVDQRGYVREDTVNDHRLVYTQDKIIKFVIGAGGDTVIEKYSDNNGDGMPDSTTPDGTVPLDRIQPIWEAGKLLALREASDRRVMTFLDENSNGTVDTGEFIDFTDASASRLRPYLGAADNTEAQDIINFIRGVQIAGYRDRELTVAGEEGRVWKLGDIVYSSPSVVGAPVSNFNFIYGDQSYAQFFAAHEQRDVMIYVGANDGMLHAFWAGKFHTGNDSTTSGIQETGWYSAESELGTTLGEELWAYIPYNLVPHLKWLTDPNYPHVYYVDLKPLIIDAKIFTADSTHTNGWGTVLIGGMRLGGGPREITDDFSGDGTPETKTFRSAYFALDITVPQSPRLLWEFTDSRLAFTTSYPTIVKINDQYFTVFGSGPTDYMGTSSQQGHVFVLELASGQLRRVFDVDNNAFLADPIAVDVTLDYSVDVVYIGETYKPATDLLGKMYRLSTKVDGNYSPVPNSWTLSTLFATETGQPITAAAGSSFDEDRNLWVYFGTGKYMSVYDKTDTNMQSFYGIKDPCHQGDCTTTISRDALFDSSNVVINLTGGVSGAGGTVSDWNSLVEEVRDDAGWYINLFASGSEPSERVIHKAGILGGIVFFTAFTPNSDVCGFGGSGRLYALNFETGSANREQVIGTDGNEVLRSRDLGAGVPSRVAIHVGQEEHGATGYVQQSTGIIERIELNVGEGMEPGVISWREVR